jgi:hypothetical protein
MRRRGLVLATLFVALYGALYLVGAELALALAVLGTVAVGVGWWARGVMHAGPSLSRSERFRSAGYRSVGYDAAVIGAYAASTTVSPSDCSAGASFGGDCGGAM